jgi:hypothetical protein
MDSTNCHTDGKLIGKEVWENFRNRDDINLPPYYLPLKCKKINSAYLL